MPTLYPENTQYSTPEKTIPNLLSNGANLYKRKFPEGMYAKGEIPSEIGENSEYIRKLIGLLQQKLTNQEAQQSSNTTLDVGESLKHAAETQAPSYSLPEPKVGVSELPEDYRTWKSDKEGRWIAPTKAAKISTVPKFLGGGQYVFDPTQPGKLIKSRRGPITDYEQYKKLSSEEQVRVSQIRTMLTGGNPDAQVDHIIPLWAGGADTLENMMTMRKSKHNVKTKIQAVPLTLLEAGLISKDQAKTMAQGWEDIMNTYDVSRIPQPYLKTDSKTGEIIGTHDVETAKRLSEEWKKVKEPSFIDYLKEVPETRKTIGKSMTQWTEGLPNVVSNFWKGLITESSMGIIPTIEKPPETFMGTVGYGLGAGIGMLSPLSVFAKAIGLAGRGLGKIPVIADLLARKGGTVAEVGEKVGEAKKAFEASKITGGGQMIETPGLKVIVQPYKGAKKFSIEKHDKKFRDIAKVMAKNAGIFSAYGQTRLSVPTLFGDPDPGFDDRVTQLGFDILYGGGLGFFSKTLKGTSLLGGSVLGLGLMEQYFFEGEPDVSEAFANSVVMMALHRLPTQPGKIMKKIGLKGMGQDEKFIKIQEESIKKFEKYSNDLADIYATEIRANILSHKPGSNNPYLEYSKNTKALPLEERNPETIKARSEEMRKIIAEEGKKGLLEPDEMKLQEDMITLSENQLLKGKMSEIEKRKMAEKDVVSFGKELVKRYQGARYTDSDYIKQIIDGMPHEIREKIFWESKEPNENDINGSSVKFRMWVDGATKGTDSKTRESRIEFEKGLLTGESSPVVLTISRPEFERILRTINSSITEKEIQDKIHMPDDMPWYAEQVFGLKKRKVKNEDGSETYIIDYMPLGWIAKPFRLEGGVHSVNNQMRKYKKSEYNLEHNANTLGELKNKHDIKINTGYVTHFRLDTKSEEPSLEITILDKDIQNGSDFKQYYTKGTEEGKPSTIPLGEAITEANNNPTKEKAIKAVQAIAEKRYIDPHIALNESGLSITPGIQIVNDVLTKFAGKIYKNNPQKIKEEMNKEFGQIIDDIQAQYLFDNKKTITIDDYRDILSKGIKEGKANPKAIIDYEGIIKFLDSGEFSKNPLSSIFRGIPLIGAGKKEIGIVGKEIKRKFEGQYKVAQSLKGKELLEKRLRKEEEESPKKREDEIYSNLINLALKRESKKEKEKNVSKEFKPKEVLTEDVGVVEVPKPKIKEPPTAEITEAASIKKKESIVEDIEDVDTIEPRSLPESVLRPDEQPVSSVQRRKINAKDILEESDGVNKAAIKSVDKKLASLDNNSQEAKDLISFRDSFTRKNIKAGAKESFKESNGDEAKGAEIFIKRISDAFTKKGLDDPTKGYENSQAFKKRFRDSIYKKPSTIFTQGEKGKIEIKSAEDKPFSFVEEAIGKKFIYFEENEKLPKWDRFDENEKKKFLLKNGYVPFYYDHKPGSLLGIEFDSSMAGGKKITDSGALGEFLDSVADRLGLETINDIAKRFKSLNSREIVNPIKGETWKHFIIKNESGLEPTIKDSTPDWSDISVSNVVANKEKVLSDLGGKGIANGTEYVSPEKMKRIAHGAGFQHEPYWMKPTQSFIDQKTGKLFHQKLEMRSWTPEEKKIFEKMLGRKLEETDIVTFEDNVKVGYGKVGKDMGNYWEVEAPSESYRFKYSHPHEERGSLSIGGIMSKSGAGKEIGEHFRPFAENIKTVSEELQASSGAFDIEAIWKRHPEFSKDMWMENLYGDLKKSAEHGAGLTQVGKRLNTEINSIIKQYLNGTFLKGDNLHIKPDWKAKTDKSTGEKVNLGHDELMIPKKSFIKLYGEEAYTELKDGKEFYVLAFRYPTIKDTSVIKRKVLIAEDNGQHIGDSQIVVKASDTKNLDHDTDGDQMQIFAIEGKNGVPKAMSDYFKAKEKEGDMIFSDLEKTAKILRGDGDTYQKLMEYSEKNLAGGEAISIASSTVRPMRFLSTNNYEMRVGAIPAGGIGKRTIEHVLNGKVYESYSVPSAVANKDQFSKSPKTAFIVKPTFSDKESYMIGQIIQEATDTVGTTNLMKRLKESDGNISNYIMERIFSNVKDDGTRLALSKFLKKLQVPYKVENNAIETLKPYMDFIKKVKADGGKLGPVEEIVLNLDGIKPIDYYRKNDAAQLEIDKLGVESVLKAFPSGINTKNPILNKFINLWETTVKSVKKGKASTTEMKDLGKIAWKDFSKKYDLTNEDKKDIAIWASTDPDANLAWTGGRYMVRPTFLINESPEVAKAFFEGENLYPNLKKIKKETP